MHSNYFLVACLLLMGSLVASEEAHIKKVVPQKEYDVVFFFKQLPPEISDYVISFAVFPLNQVTIYEQMCVGHFRGWFPEQARLVSTRKSTVGETVFVSPNSFTKKRLVTQAYPCITQRLIASHCYKK